MGELLEDGVLRVGVSGTLVSMRIGPRACLEAWRFQGTRGGREWLEGHSRNMQRPRRRRDSTGVAADA